MVVHKNGPQTTEEKPIKTLLARLMRCNTDTECATEIVRHAHSNKQDLEGVLNALNDEFGKQYQHKLNLNLKDITVDVVIPKKYHRKHESKRFSNGKHGYRVDQTPFCVETKPVKKEPKSTKHLVVTEINQDLITKNTEGIFSPGVTNDEYRKSEHTKRNIDKNAVRFFVKYPVVGSASNTISPDEKTHSLYIQKAITNLHTALRVKSETVKMDYYSYESSSIFSGTLTTFAKPKSYEEIKQKYLGLAENKEAELAVIHAELIEEPSTPQETEYDNVVLPPQYINNPGDHNNEEQDEYKESDNSVYPASSHSQVTPQVDIAQTSQHYRTPPHDRRHIPYYQNAQGAQTRNNVTIKDSPEEEAPAPKGRITAVRPAPPAPPANRPQTGGNQASSEESRAAAAQGGAGAAPAPAQEGAEAQEGAPADQGDAASAADQGDAAAAAVTGGTTPAPAPAADQEGEAPEKKEEEKKNNGWYNFNISQILSPFLTSSSDQEAKTPGANQQSWPWDEWGDPMRRAMQSVAQNIIPDENRQWGKWFDWTNSDFINTETKEWLNNTKTYAPAEEPSCCSSWTSYTGSLQPSKPATARNGDGDGPGRG